MSNANERYRAAAHAMQTGVKMKMTRDGVGDPDEGYAPRGECSPKHLRVGINAAMSDHGALTKLLIDKGIIGEEEYLEAIADGMEREVQLYRTELGLGDNVHLG